MLKILLAIAAILLAAGCADAGWRNKWYPQWPNHSKVYAIRAYAAEQWLRISAINDLVGGLDRWLDQWVEHAGIWFLVCELDDPIKWRRLEAERNIRGIIGDQAFDSGVLPFPPIPVQFPNYLPKYDSES